MAAQRGRIGNRRFSGDAITRTWYRTAPLAGQWPLMGGGFYHDGRFATLEDVIGHYNVLFGLGLTREEIADLAEYLKSI